MKKTGWENIELKDTIQLLKDIGQWSSTNLKTSFISDIEKSLRWVLSERFAKYKQLNDPIFRIRKQCAPEFFFSSKSELLCPQPKHITKEGRINRIKDPVLYCALKKETAIEEVSLNLGDFFVLITYSPIKPIECLDLIWDNPPEELNKQGTINFHIINNFIRSEFCRPAGLGSEYVYRISYLLCRKLFEKHDGWIYPSVGGWIYPSVANFGKGKNVAISPSIANQYLKIESAFMCRLDGYYNNVYYYSKIGKAEITQKERVKWKELNQEDRETSTAV
jgi:hypothetical protein